MTLLRDFRILGALLMLLTLVGCSGAAQEASSNTVPLAKDVTLSASDPSPHVGTELQGGYRYVDTDGDNEGGTLKVWLRDGQPIDGANQDKYIATPLDSGKKLQFSVTPVPASGKSPGDTVVSAEITIVNSVPAASDVTVAAPLLGATAILKASVGYELSVKFKYSDVDLDEAAPPLIRWLRRTSTDEIAIPDATSTTYVVTPEDIDQSLVAEVTPIALQGNMQGVAVRSQPILIVAVPAPNSIPVAQNVALTASTTPAAVGTKLTVSYTYFDADGDPEAADGSAIQWRSGSVPIPGETGLSYTLTPADSGKTILVRVIPASQIGASPGLPMFSNPITVVNSAPQASSVTVSGASAGVAAVGNVLHASYTYTDNDLDPQAASILRWYRGSSIIPGAVSLDYTVTTADINNDLFFEVVPVASQGELQGSAVRSTAKVHVANSAPVAKNVMLALQAGTPPTLTASYAYFDVDGDLEGASLIRWLGNGAPITAAQGLTYTLLSADTGKTIIFEVTPVAATGELKGSATLSNGIVTDNAAPIASNVSIAPSTAAVNTLLTGSYTYSDANSDAEGTSLYEWNNGTSVVGTAKTYTVTAADAHRTLTFKVTPVAAAGTSPGIAVTSTGLTIDNSPPSVAGLSISGSVGGKVYAGLVLSASYTFQDPDNDGEGATAYQWMRNGNAIGTATARTYTVTTADIDAPLTVQVTPKDNFTSPLAGAAVVSPPITPVNLAPVASNVAINTKPVYQVGDVVNVTYTRTDLESDPEPAGGSAIQWMRRDAATGKDAMIVGATAATYTLVLADMNQTISAQVTPLSQTGTTPGLPVISNSISVANNTAPVAKNVSLSANTVVAIAGTVLTASYTYFDAEGNLESASVTRWLRNGAAITDASGKSYTATTADAGQSIVFEVTPYAVIGIPSGTTVLSNSIAISKSYSVGGTVSGLPAGTSIVLQNNAADDLTVSGNGVFTFNAQIVDGTWFNVTVKTQPAQVGQVCTTLSSAGTVPATNVTGIVINCGAEQYPRFSYMTNYDDNTISIYTVNASTGELRANGYVMASGINPTSVTVDPSGKFAYVANQGSYNVSAYAINPRTGTLTNIGLNLAAGASPRQVVVDPSGKFAYVLNSSSADVSAYAINDNTGALTTIACSIGATCNGVNFKAGGDTVRSVNTIAIDPSGKFAYVTAGVDEVWAYTINATTGVLTPIDANPSTLGVIENFKAGTYPEFVTVDPSGKFVYVANYGSSDISAYIINVNTGDLGQVDCSAGGGGVACNGANFKSGVQAFNTNPIFITIDPSGKFAYVANSGSNDVTAYTINASTGALTRIGLPVAVEASPYSVTVDPSGKFAYVVNYDSRKVLTYTIDTITGALTPAGDMRTRFRKPPEVVFHPTAFFAMTKGTAPVTYTPNFAYVTNLRSDTVSTYPITANGSLTAVGSTEVTAVGSSPNSIAVDPSGKFAYVANNWLLNGVYSISSYTIASGVLTSTGTVNPAVSSMAPLAVAVDPSGRFVYVSSEDGLFPGNIATYTINASTGGLSLAGTAAATGGKPTSIAIDPTGRFVYAANSSIGDGISAYSISTTTGALTPIVFSAASGVTNFPSGSNPSSVTVDPSGKYAYVANFSTDDIWTYGINAATGALTKLAAYSVTPSISPVSIAIDPTGRFAYVAHNPSNTSLVADLLAFDIDPATGALSNRRSYSLGVNAAPGSVTVDASGKYVYVANFGTNNILGFSIDASGSLTANDPTPGFPISKAGSGPESITTTATIQ